MNVLNCYQNITLFTGSALLSFINHKDVNWLLLEKGKLNLHLHKMGHVNTDFTTDF